MKYVILEDEPLAAERVKEFADRHGDLQHCGTFQSVVAAMDFLENHRVGLVFLDINLGDITGIQFLQIMRPDCSVIVTTAYQQYAIKGFELQVTDYLLKPYTFERFSQAVARAKAQQIGNQPPKDHIFIKTRYRLERMLLDDVLYIEGARDYRRIHTRNQQLMTLQTFGELEAELPDALFIRVHKSYLVSLNKIESLDRDFIRISNTMIPVSETYKKALLNKLTK